MSSNKFLSFGSNSVSTNSSSTFIIGSNSKILSIDIKSTDEIINLPDPLTVDFDVIQYRKTIITPRDIIFNYAGLQKGKIHFHRFQNISFHKFNASTSTPGWIC
jgi:hypothetical protein